MKRYFFLFILCYSAILSCNKNEVNLTLNGSWRMVLVTDNATGAETKKSSLTAGEIELTFKATNASSGSFTGHTTVNDFDGSFTTDRQGSLTVTEFGMTKVGETSWGNSFIDNFRNALSYSLKSNHQLTVKSAAKTLTFQRE